MCIEDAPTLSLSSSLNSFFTSLHSRASLPFPFPISNISLSRSTSSPSSSSSSTSSSCSSCAQNLNFTSTIHGHSWQAKRQMHPSTPPPPETTTLDLITHLLSVLLLSSLSIKSFIGRWQILRTKLVSLQSSISSISSSSHWSDNSLLQALLPNLLTTLRSLKSLSDQCLDSDFIGGKLLMQSDLDMASASLSKLHDDIDLLLRSGVLHSNAIVLSQPGPESRKDDLAFFVRDLFTRLQIGGIEFKKKALESLIQLLTDDEKSALIVAKEGNIAYLIHLLDFYNHPSIREQSASAVSILASASDLSMKSVFEEGGLGPLLRMIDSGSVFSKEKAALAVESITADSENVWAVSAYGGVSILLEACRSGSPVTQNHAAGALKNIAMIEDFRILLGEEGAILVLIHLLAQTTTTTTQQKAANCISILASSNEYLRTLILQEKGLQRLIQMVHDVSNLDTLEHVLRSLSAFSSDSTSRSTLSSSTTFITQIGELIKHGNTLIQQISTSLLANLSISDGNKRAISSIMGSLVKLMESSKPAGLHESAAQALIMLLTVKSNRKELARDEKSVMRLVQMLDPKNEVVGKKFPAMVVSAIVSGGSQGCRKRLVAAGAYQHLQRLSEMEVAGAKKAVQRLGGNRLKSIFSRTWRE